MIRILLVDEHPLFREGLRGLIEKAPGCQCVAEAGSPEEAAVKFTMTSPSLVVLGLVFGGAPKFEMVEHFAASAKVLVMTSERSKWEVLGSIQAGASGFLNKNASREQFFAALHDLRAGRNHLHSEVTRVVFESLRGSSQQPLKVALTARESELLELLGRGGSPQEIALQLHLAPSTIKTHIRNLFRKFEVNSRNQLILKAVELELIALRSQ